MDGRMRDRVRGCAVGAAVGDALGMPLEFGPRLPGDRLVREMLPRRLPAGTFTDDTEMALALVDSLLACRGLDPADLAGRFASWLEAGPDDVGNHTRAVLSAVASGADWEEAAEGTQRRHPDSAGNGSVMRCWPVAVARWDDQERLLADSRLQSRVTHPHPECVEACAHVNALLYHLFRGFTPAPRAADCGQGGSRPRTRRAGEQRLGAPHDGERPVGAADDRFIRGSRRAGGQPRQ